MKNTSNPYTKCYGARSYSNSINTAVHCPKPTAVRFKHSATIVPLPDIRKLQDREKEWVPNFHMMFSKDNYNYPKNMRELFEAPIQYNTDGTRQLVAHPYGWDIIENYPTLNSAKSRSPKIAAINTIAFTNYISSIRQFKRPQGVLAPISPKGNACQLHTNHSLVKY